jgi:outer membrane protein assembly factor BamA
MRRELKIVLLFALLVSCKFCFTQSLTITFTDVGKTKNYKISALKCDDSLFIKKVFSNCLIPLYSKGFIASSIDSFSCSSNSISAFGIMGAQYRWVNFSPDSATSMLLNDAGIKVPKHSKKPINPNLLIKYFNSTLHQLEDNGYPFALVKLDKVDIKPNCISALIHIDKGYRIFIDTIYLKGDARIAPYRLAALIDLKKGELYSESKIKRIDQRIRQHQYINSIKPSEIEFLNHKARVYCYLSNKPASRFSGLAGFYSDKTNGKIKFNGDLNLSLVNTLKYSEKINFAWSAPGKGTQHLNIATDWPYIFGKQVGVVGSFSLFRCDSTFITINPKISFSFFASNGGRFLLNLDFKKTSYTLNSEIQNNQYGNSQAFLYGLGYEYNNYDNLYLPTRGILLKTNVNTGSRNLNQKQSSKSNLIEEDLFVEGFIPITENRFILALRSNSKHKIIYNSKGNTSLFENELYRVGGMGTIRGFNQETILSSAYSIATLELHMRMSEGSGLYLFTDKGFVKSHELGHSIDRWPLGVGLGLNLVTKAGLFNLSYALGQGFGQSLGFRDAKVHFGIATFF